MKKKIPDWVIRYGIPAAVVILGGLIGFAGYKAARAIELRPARGETLPADTPTMGIGRTVDRETAGVYLGDCCREDPETVHWLETYTEWEGVVPEWYRPWESMAAEWEDDNARQSDSNPIQRTEVGLWPIPEVPAPREASTDAGCPDWNLDSTVWGWDGHGAEAWELDLLARVFYLEFWGTSIPCSEAGCDAILNLWDTGKYGRSLFEALSYYDPEYGYTYRVYPKVWQTDYNAEGLAWCKEFCAERFMSGPEWGAVYFQLGGYHDTDWVPPLYEMDGVFFSGAAYGGQ